MREGEGGREREREGRRMGERGHETEEEGEGGGDRGEERRETISSDDTMTLLLHSFTMMPTPY